MKAEAAGASKVAKVVITRSREGNAQLAKSLKELGFDPIQVDTIEFLPPADWSPVDSGLRGLRRFDWLLFTSATGVDFFVDRMKALGLELPWLGKPAVAAVGEKTRAALQRNGVEAGFVPTRYLMQALADELPAGGGAKVLLLRADIADPQPVATLRRRGFLVDDLTVYRTSPAVGEDPAVEPAVMEADAIVFASPSAVEAFVGRMSPPDLASLRERIITACIGPVTAAAARRHGFEQIVTPKTHTIDDLVRELRDAAPGGGP